MNNQAIIGLALIGFGLLLLFSDEPYSWVFSAMAVGVVQVLLLKKIKKMI